MSAIKSRLQSLKGVQSFLGGDDSEEKNSYREIEPVHWLENTENRIMAYTDLDPEFFDNKSVIEALEDAAERDVEIDILYHPEGYEPVEELEELAASYNSVNLAEGKAEKIDDPLEGNQDMERWYLVVDDNYRIGENPPKKFGVDGYSAISDRSPGIADTVSQGLREEIEELSRG